MHNEIPSTGQAVDPQGYELVRDGSHILVVFLNIPRRIGAIYKNDFFKFDRLVFVLAQLVHFKHTQVHRSILGEPSPRFETMSFMDLGHTYS